MLWQQVNALLLEISWDNGIPCSAPSVSIPLPVSLFPFQFPSMSPFHSFPVHVPLCALVPPSPCPCSTFSISLVPCPSVSLFCSLHIPVPPSPCPCSRVPPCPCSRVPPCPIPEQCRCHSSGRAGPLPPPNSSPTVPAGSHLLLWVPSQLQDPQSPAHSRSWCQHGMGQGSVTPGSSCAPRQGRGSAPPPCLQRGKSFWTPPVGSGMGQWRGKGSLSPERSSSAPSHGRAWHGALPVPPSGTARRHKHGDGM